MTKQNMNLAAIAAIVLAVLALILQLVFAASQHSARALAAEIAWPILIIVGVGLFIWARRLKS
jgi:LytS/YehU family sensor histidine kinase